MIPNLLNVLLGIVLTYAAILQPGLLSGRPAVLAAGGVVMFAAAWLARRSDHHPWQNNTNMLLAVLLVVLALSPIERSPVTSFWANFWIGIVVAVLALWAALYRPTTMAPRSE